MSGDRPGFVDGKIVDWELFSASVEKEELDRTSRERDDSASKNAPWADVLDAFENIEPGAPRPRVMSNEDRTALLYYPSSRGPLRWVLFREVLYTSFGYPSEEALKGHALYGAGLRHFRVHEVFNSALIADMEKRNRVHEHHKPESFTRRRHILFALHDSTFDCVCSDWATGTTEIELGEAMVMAIEALKSGEFPEPASQVDES